MVPRPSLTTPIRQLALSLKGSRVERVHMQLLQELSDKGLNFKPYIWISDDWFCPDGAPGFAVPFFLLDPELTKLEKKQMGRCEGETERELMKLMRHECAHAIDNAFGLRRKRERQQLFGKSKTRYPSSYIPDLSSRDYVEHLGEGYAQAHPDEDWAETFAVWLAAKNLNVLKRRYLGTKAWDKIEYVDRLMKGLIGLRQPNRARWQYDSYRQSTLSLGRYYEKKKARRSFGPLFEQSELRALALVKGKSFKRVLAKNKGPLLEKVIEQTQAPLPIVVQVVRELSQGLAQSRLGFEAEASYTDKVLIDLLSRKTSQYLQEERNRILM